ncbi:MAG: nucleotidyltransferase family protein [Gemmatimonadales bacterium]
MRLLLLCSRSVLPEAGGESLRGLLEAEIDWDFVWEAGHWHGVLPLLSHNLHAVASGLVPEGLVPEEMLDRLRGRHQATAYRNLYMTAELLQLIGAFEEAGVASIPLKGAVLAHTLYPNSALREFSDLDILVRKEGLSRAKQVLSTLGFLLTRADPAGGQETAFRWRLYAYFFRRPTDGLVVDLHWKLAPTYMLTAIPVEKLWNQTRSCRIGGMEVRSFSPEVTLLLLCFHGAKHGPVPWPRLKWLCDLSELLRIHPDLNWRELFVSADACGSGRIVDLGLRLACDLLEAPLPEAVERRVRSDAAVASIATQVGERLLQDRREPMQRLERLRQQLSLRERRRDKLLILISHGFVPQDSDWELVRLPRALAFLYFPLRLLRLAFKFGLARPLRWLGEKLRKRDPPAEMTEAAVTREVGST